MDANIHLQEQQYLAGEREAEIADLRESDEAIYGADVCELRVCEIQHLMLRPNQKYIFTVDPTCASCVRYAAEVTEPFAKAASSNG